MSGATSDAVYTAGEELTLKAVPAEGYSLQAGVTACQIRCVQ